MVDPLVLTVSTVSGISPEDPILIFFFRAESDDEETKTRRRRDRLAAQEANPYHLVGRMNVSTRVRGGRGKGRGVATGAVFFLKLVSS